MARIEPMFGRRGDRLLVAERNAVILYAGGAKFAAATALGWSQGKSKTDGRWQEFVEREIDRIRKKAAALAAGRPWPEKEDEMRDDDRKKPLRVDEREAEPPAPPEEERLDERVEEVPPTPPTPPECEPEDLAAA